MTFSRNIDSDRSATSAILAEVANGVEPPKKMPNWLGHKKAAAQLDRLLLYGATMQHLRKHRGAVKEHFRHLRIEHGINVVVQNDVYRMLILPVES
jgi:hypothetical protein